MKRQTVTIVAVLLAVVAAGARAQEPSTAGVLGTTQVGTLPVAVAINAGLNLAFVVNKGSQDVMVVNLATRAVTGRYQVGGIPVSVAVNQKNNMVVVTSLNNEVTVIDHDKVEIAGKVSAGKSPLRVAIDEENNTALVTNFNGSNMMEIDIPSREVKRTIALKNGPTGIAMLPGQRRAVVASQYDMEIIQVDLDGGKMDQRLLVGRYLSDVAFQPEGGRFVVVNPSSNGIVTVYNPADNTAASTLPVGAGPLSVAVYPKRNVALVSEFNGGTVSIVDLALSRVVRTVTVAKGPEGIAVHPQSGVAVVVNRLSNLATFLDVEALLGPAPTQ